MGAAQGSSAKSRASSSALSRGCRARKLDKMVRTMVTRNHASSSPAPEYSARRGGEPGCATNLHDQQLIFPVIDVRPNPRAHATQFLIVQLADENAVLRVIAKSMEYLEHLIPAAITSDVVCYDVGRAGQVALTVW